MSDAIWNFHKPLLDSIAQGMISGGTITRVDINDASKRLKVKLVRKNSHFDVFKISREIPLFHTYTDGKRVPIGVMTVKQRAIVTACQRRSIAWMVSSA